MNSISSRLVNRATTQTVAAMPSNVTEAVISQRLSQGGG